MQFNANYLQLIFKIISVLTLFSQEVVFGQREDESSVSVTLYMEMAVVGEPKVELFVVKDTVTIYYRGDFVLYRMPAVRRLETDQKIPGTEPFFFYNEHNTFGYFFKNILDTAGVRYPVDSVLRSRGYKSDATEIVKSAVFHKHESDGDILVEKYFYLNRESNEAPDSLFFNYKTAMKDIRYTFSQKHDSSRKSKLFKIEWIFNSKYSDKYQILLPKKVVFVELIDNEAIDDSMRRFCDRLIMISKICE